MERIFLAVLVNAYQYDKKRENIVLKIPAKLAPVKAAIFPLIKNNKALVKLARKIYDDLKIEFNTEYDESGSIGKRYARQDEIGTPICITVDYDSIKNKDVTIRDRDTTKQKRRKIEDVKNESRNKILK